MRRATITLGEELEGTLESYRHDQEFPPSLAALMQAALTEYLAQRGYSSPEKSGNSSGRAIYEDAPSLRGEKTASEVVLEDRG